ncbi:MAG TPA: winged helix DNA-binding domain-containing protein [Trueperaceae bacterium]
MDPAERELAAARVRNVLLGPRRLGSPAEVVAHLLAVQAQEPAFSRWSVAQRTLAPDEPAVAEALATAAIVRVHALRPTWHYLRGEDLRWVQALTGPRVLRSSAGWYRNHGVDDAFLDAGRAVVEDALADGEYLTRDQLREVVAAAGLDVSGQRMTALMFDLELKTVVCSGPLRDRKHTYALVDERLPRGGQIDAEEATARLVKRYLTGHAPATLKDLRWWSGLKVSELSVAADALGDAVVRESVGGREYLWLADAPPAQAAQDEPSFELLQVFDELFVGYSDTRDLLDADGEFGPVLQIGFSKMMHVVIEGDRLLGRWRQDRRADALTLTFDLKRPLAGKELAELREAAAAYGAFVGSGGTEVVLAPNTR